MKTLDRYIVGQFLLNFLILSVVLMTFFVAVDLMFNLDEFLEAGEVRSTAAAARAAAAAGGGEGSGAEAQATTVAYLAYTLWSIWDFYGPTVLVVYVFVAGLLVVTAMGFTFAGMTRFGELTAIVTSGVSMYRIAAPVVVVGGLLNLATLVNQEWLIPPLAHKLIRTHSQAKYETIDHFAIRYVPDGRGNLFTAQQFDTQRATLHDVVILVRDAQGRTLERISAATATWGEGEQGWHLAEASILRPQAVIDAGSSVRGITPGVGVGGDSAWAVAGAATGDDLGADGSMAGDQAPLFFASDLSPPVLLARRADVYPTLLGLGELNRLLENPAADARQIQRIMHSRFSLMVINVLVLAMGLPFFLLREPANQVLQTAKAAMTVLPAWGGGIVLLPLAAQTLPPVAAAWLPVAILLPVTAVLLLSVRT